jgi:Na+/H+ antiporter NhaD/arsenite permease-like protein
MKPVQKLGLLFITVLVPYFALIFYVAAMGINNMPTWSRWAFPVYFVVSIFALTVVISKLKKKPQQSVTLDAEPNQRDRKESLIHRPVKRLLRTYLIFFPLAVMGVFVQKEIPVKFALLALTVPALLIAILWRSLGRTKVTDGGAHENR